MTAKGKIVADNSSEQHFALTVSIAIEALKALLIVNGGAATALIALTGKAQNGPNYSLAILLFGLAALLNAVTLIIGYFSQLSYANHRFAVEQQDTVEITKNFKAHCVYQYCAIAVLSASLAASAGGMFFAFRAL
jgi:hypothetical protein